MTRQSEKTPANKTPFLFSFDGFDGFLRPTKKALLEIDAVFRRHGMHIWGTVFRRHGEPTKKALLEIDAVFAPLFLYYRLTLYDFFFD
jgi:hypothetical protein